MDTTAIVVEIIASIAIIIVAILTNKATRDKILEDMKVQDALQANEMKHLKTEMDEIKTDIKKSNVLVQKIPVIETNIEHINGDIKELKRKAG